MEIHPLVDKTFNLLISDSKFVDHLESSIQHVFEDNKIDVFDIPEIIFIIVDAYNAISKIKLDNEKIFTLIKLLTHFIIEKIDGIPKGKKCEFEKLVDSSIKLVMLQPIVAKKIKKCTNYFCCGKKNI